MPLPIEEIKRLIKESIPDATIEIKDLMGDNNHYEATIISSKFTFTLRERINFLNLSKFSLINLISCIFFFYPFFYNFYRKNR